MSTLDPYNVKAIEYIACLVSVGLFAAFWAFVNGGLPAPEPVHAWVGHLAEWFRVPDTVFFHPGHAWAKAQGSGRALVGMDDFAQRLVGPAAAIALPAKGSVVTAGAPAWSITADAKTVDMLAPVSGRVVAVNEAVRNNPHLVSEDPYGRGWLFAVEAPRLRDTLRDLLSGARARRWMADTAEALDASFTPELGHLCQDGGVPVNGFARAIDAEHWEQVARRFLLS